MKTLDELLTTAKGRAYELGASYEGCTTPQETFHLLQLLPSAKLVDVRSRAELIWVGRIPGAIEVEWMSYPSNQPNTDFIAQLTSEIPDKSLAIFFICRLGSRSAKAAALATMNGFLKCYNVLEGFEGDIDPTTGQRGHINGWRHIGLPWKS